MYPNTFQTIFTSKHDSINAYKFAVSTVFIPVFPQIIQKFEAVLSSSEYDIPSFPGGYKLHIFQLTAVDSVPARATSQGRYVSQKVR